MDVIKPDRTRSEPAMSDSQPNAYHKSPDKTPPAPAACPVDRSFSPFQKGYLQNPYPELEKLNAERPIFYSTELKSLVVTRMDQILDIFKNPDVYSSANVQDPVFPLCKRAEKILAARDFDPVAVMSNRQPPDHTRIRKYTREGFSGRRMKILEPYIRKLSHELIDQMLTQGPPAEVVRALTHPLPGRIIFRLIGFPETDDEQLMRWTANRLAFTWGKPSDDEQVEIAGNMLRYWRYCRRFVAQRTESPADDLTSELLAAHQASPDELGYREVESVIYGLSFAGHEIVSNFIANALLCLLTDRTKWEALCVDPDLIPKALEEVLRFESPQTSWRRIATRDTRIGDIEIPAGTQLFLSLGAANHEQDLFPSPSEFDVHRRNAGKHISFGHGIHFCLGARLARLEGQIAIESLTERTPGLRLVAGQKLRYSPNITFRGPRELYVEWDS
jgi:cytochrome P450